MWNFNLIGLSFCNNQKETYNEFHDAADVSVLKL